MGWKEAVSAYTSGSNSATNKVESDVISNVTLDVPDNTKSNTKNLSNWDKAVEQKLKQEGYVSPKNQTSTSTTKVSNNVCNVELKREDGTSIGFISQSGIKAIQENSVSKYVPVNAEEKKTIEAYIKYASQKRQEKIDNYKATATKELGGVKQEQSKVSDKLQDTRVSKNIANRSGKAGTQWETKDTRTAKEKREGKPVPKSEGEKELQRLKNEYAKLDEQAEALVETISDIEKYATIVYDDDGWWGQSKANYTQGRLSQDTAQAYNDYIVSPTEANRMRADALAALSEQFNINNANALTSDDENIGEFQKSVRDWVAVSFAGYLPQFIDQIKASIKGAATGAVAGAAVGSFIPAIGTATGAVIGIRSGWVSGSSTQMLETTRGMVFKTLIDAGYDEETAIKAANDEAFVSSIIEGAGELLSMATLGTGKLIGKIAPNAVKKVSNNVVAKGIKGFVQKTGKTISENIFLKTTASTAGVLINAVGEYAEEYTQEAVSIANERRLKNKNSTSLIGETFSVLRDQDAETSERLHNAGTQGFKIGLMMGGATKIGTSTIEYSSYVNAGKKIKQADSNESGVVQSIIDVGLKHPQDTQSYKLATKLSQQDKISNYSLGKLAEANKSENVNVGDLYYNIKTKDFFSVVGRDDNATTIVMVTPDGISKTKAFSNESADQLTNGNRFVLVDRTVATTDETATSPTEDNSATVAENETVGVQTKQPVNTPPYGEAVPYSEIVNKARQTTSDTSVDNTLDTTNTEVSNDQVTQVSRENDVLANVYNALVSEKLTSKTINNIIDTRASREAFEQLTGIELNGTKSEQRAIVRNFHNDAQNIENLKIKHSETLETPVETKNVPVADKVATTGETTPSAQSNATSDEIAVVTSAVIDTLKPGAWNEIRESMESYERKHNVRLNKTIDTFIGSLIRAYKKTGTIGHVANHFSDGGKKVIASIESTLVESNFRNETVVETTRNTEDVLQNQSESATIELKTTTKTVPGADKSHTASYTNDNQKIDLKFKVVSVDDLIASNDLDGKVNPDYPQELQPRDRSRVSSKSQISQMANSLNPARLAESTSVSEGAPIVGPDNVVESGNGRTLAIKLAYQTGFADEYRNYIIDNAEAYGIDVSNLPEKPVLVRERLTEVNRVEFTRKANESSIGSLSATEQAKVDAEKLSNDVLNLLVANEDGVINTSDNRDFISAVINRVFKNEDLNNVVNAEGRLSSRGLERITNAIFYKAYGDISLSVRLSESLDNDMKNATKVLLNIAPRIVSIKNDIQKGESYNFDFSEDIASAVRLFEKCRNDNLKVVDYANQTSLFEKEKPLVLAMAYVFETKNRGAKQATEFYNLLLDTVEGMGSPNQISLGITDIFQSKEEILNAAFDKFNAGVITENTARGVEPTKNTITPPESIYRSESEAGRDDDRRGKDAISRNEPDENETLGDAVGIQQDNRPSKETGIVTDDEQLRQKNESIERRSEVGEENSDEQIRKDLLYGNGKRRNDGGSGKQAERILSFRRENRGKDATERQRFARELIESGQTEQVIEKSDGDTVICNLVKPEAYNDDMRAMAEKAKAKGIELGFAVGDMTVDIALDDGTIKTQPIRGVQITPTRILVKYDHSTFSPQQIYKHEYCHAKWNTPEMRKIRNTIFSSLSAQDRQNILSLQRYKDYMEGYNNNENLVWEEFVCDVMSGYSDYTDKFADVVTDFWYGNEEVEGYNPSDYTTSTDAGGKYSFDSEQYTKKEYRNFGWARANNILNTGQNADYRSKFADAKVGRAKFAKTKQGEYIIPVSDIYDKSSRGINNVLVFAKGTIANPVITSVIKINADNETDLADIRRFVYGLERRGISTQSGPVIRRYDAVDFANGYERKNIADSRDNNDNRPGKRDSKETTSSKESTKVRYSFDEKDSDYLKAVENGDMETAQRMVDEVAKTKGYNIRAYHGTRRGDRVGNVFLPERATSGPMAYFTDSKEIASNYARDKADTSLAYDEEYDSYYTQFRVNRGGKSISVPELWKYLSISQKNKIKEIAGHIKFDDDYENIIVDKSTEHGNGAYDAYTLNMHRGNVLEALVDTWLETGDLYNREADFLEVLKLVGIEDAEYRDPDAHQEKVYDTWLKIQNPFDTDFADRKFYDSLSNWIDSHDMSVYEKETSNADMWDKNNQTPETWLDKLASDMENGTTHAWTVIPDFVTDYLKEQHFDGIKDKGGKGGGDGHTVWIPFSSEQIKSSEPVTYDDNGNVIPLSQRFNVEHKDIRYSLDDSYAPTFYSHMANTIDEMKQEKIGASSVVSYLKGKGVKNEEIKWTGIEEFLEGKKSVTKAELQEFVANNQLQIEEITLDNNEIPYTQEQTEQIAEYESQRNDVFEELKSEWKKAIGTEFPMQTFGIGLESSVGNLLMETDRQLRESTYAGKEMVEARKQLKSMFEEDDFGYDSAQEAYYYASRNPDDFLYNYDLTDEQRATLERYASAKELFDYGRMSGEDGIPIETQRHLKDIAAKSDEISRKISRIKSDHTKENAKYQSKWGEYTLDGGENYREIIFKIPDSTYSNGAMSAHWGGSIVDGRGVLAHARIQDFEVDGQKMLFIEEIQSDWHNEGHQRGYVSKGDADVLAKRKELENYIKSRLGKENSAEEIAKLQEARREYLRLGENMNNADAVPDAPFKTNYHEYVLKRLMRMAAEEGYDSIGWTTADIQSKRWSEEYAEGYRIEYDQDIPKFLNKYGKKWGAKVEKTTVGNTEYEMVYIDNEGKKYPTIREWYNSVMDSYAEKDQDIWDDYISGHFKIYQKDDTMYIQHREEGYVLDESLTIKGASATVWSMPITDSMKNSVLYEGQARYSLDTDGILDFEDLWDDAIAQYGTIPKGEIPARDVDVPKKINEKDVVSRGARTMIEAGITPDDAVSEFEKRILDGTMTHEVITNKKASDWAKQQIEYHGFEEALNRWSVWSDSGKVGKKELALGMELYNQCITNKDVRNAMKIAAELVAEATNAGQTLQAMRMLKRMTPDGQLYYLEKSIQKMNEEFKNKLGKKFKDIELDEDLMEQFLTEKNAEKRDEVYDKICKNIADQIPTTKRDMWNAWRYLAMLGNPRTHMRNFFGNAVFIPSIRLKNYIGAVLEKTARVDIAERTKSLHKNRDAVKFAKNDVVQKDIKKMLQGENAKYAITSDIESQRIIFDKWWNKWIEKLRTKNFDWLEREDFWFLKQHYVDALARIITARKIDVNSITPKQLDTLRAYAVKEAQAATYRDANALADGLNAIQKRLERSDKRFVRASSILIEGVMPFKKTPMNIAKQGIYYSPVGILKGIYTATTKVKKGDATVTDVIDDISKGLSGTMAMMLGCFLASLGVLVGDDDKTKKEKAFDQMTGEQSYALKIDGKSYTIDWAAPSNLALFVGAKLYDLTKDEFTFADVTSALSAIAEPLLELSVFSGVNSVIESAKYSESTPIEAIISDMCTSYLMQALPTIGGQISRIVDGTKREYYFVDKTKDVPRGLQILIGQASSKIPFASKLFEPAVDEWGREETYGEIGERLFENVVSPGYYSEENYTRVDRELRKIFEKTGDTSVLPVIQSKSYTEDYVQYDMTAEEYSKVKRIRGQKSFELLKKLLDGQIIFKKQEKSYNSMTDQEKVKAIKKCYDEAGDYAKEQMIEKIKR